MINQEQAAEWLDNVAKIVTAKSFRPYKPLVEQQTSFLPPNAPLTRRLWHIANNIYIIPTCPVCNDPLLWKTAKKQYNKYCSTSCASKCPSKVAASQAWKLDPEKLAAACQKGLEARQATNLALYGHTNYLASAVGREDAISGKVAKYGPEFRQHELEKRTSTMVERYGVKSYRLHSDFAKKVAHAWDEHHNTGFVVQINQRRKTTNLSKYGVESPSMLQEFKMRARETCMEKYGLPYTSLVPHIRDKANQTNLRKYGNTSYSRSLMPPNALEQLNDASWLIDQHYNQQKPLIQIAEELGVGDGTVGRYLHGHGFKTKIFQTSWGHKQLSEALTQLGIEHTINDRTVIKPKELDIYIEQHRVAIEYCGLYWHSEQRGKTRLYHHTKWKACQDAGVRLLTIFEDEWIERPTQVLNKIAHMCGKLNQGVAYARKCDIVDVNATDRATFLETHHIQGDGRGSITHGLVHNGQLVAVATWIERSDGVFELNRYATARRVPGGLSKLVSHFKKVHQWTQLISFADLRYSNGDMYATSGWRLDKVLAPDYSYSPDGVTRHHKFNYRRDRLAKMLEDFDPTLSEWENCFNHAILRLWDCGKLKFTQDNI